MATVVSNPLLAENPQTKVAPLAAEPMSRRAETDDRLAGIDELFNVLHALGRCTEPRKDDHQIGIIEFLQPRKIILIVGVDVALLRMQREQHGAVKAVMLAQNLGQHGHRFFRAVFLVAGNQHDFLAFARSVLSRELKQFGGRGISQRGSKAECHQADSK